MSNTNRQIRKINNEKKKKRKNFPIIKAILLLMFLIGIPVGISFLYNHPVLINSSLTTVSVGSKYDPKDAVSFVFFGSKKDVKAKTNVDSKKLGDYKTTYSFKNYKITVPVKVIDDVPPILELKEYTTDLVEEVTPEHFIKKVKDASEFTTKIKSQKNKGKDKYKITIEAEDVFGNKTTESTILTRIKDEEAPKFDILYNEAVFNEGERYDEDPGIVVTDNLDASPVIESNVYQVITGAGDYVVTYSATDRSGNTSTAERKVHVNSVPEENLKVVYFTFDDGPSNNTERVLNILAEKGVKATFFVTGNGQSRNDLIQRAYAEGHSIGLHSYSHDYAIYSDKDTYFADLHAISDMVHDLIGIRSKLVRFPGGSSNTISANYCDGIMTELTQELTKRGYFYFDWNVSSSDASGNNVDTDYIIECSEAGTAYDHIVLLMHDTDAKDTTVEALPDIIDFYREQGYVFKGLSYRSPECHHGVNN